jgi:hypothetical protein
MDTEDDTVTEAILDEIGRLGGVIESRLEAADWFVAAADSIAGIGLTPGLFQESARRLNGSTDRHCTYLHIHGPDIPRASMQSGHRQALEAIVKRRIGEPVLIGQSTVSAKYPRKANAPWILVLAAVVWVATVALGGYTASSEFNQVSTRWLVFLAHGVVVAISVWTLCLAVREKQSAEAKSRTIAGKAYAIPAQGLKFRIRQ